jgi:transcriptional regulator with XRE-family HTH domain
MNQQTAAGSELARQVRRRELARFLRARRESLAPVEVGLADHRRRRTPGLRREEVAQLAGIGVAWYSKLEMAHDVRPSAATLSAVGQALRLSDAEREYMFALAEIAIPQTTRIQGSGIPEALEQLVPSVRGLGVVIWDHYVTPLRWNAIGDAMFGCSAFDDPLERNHIVQMNDRERWTQFFGDEYPAVIRTVVGMFRKAYVTGEPTDHARRVYEIARHYPEFAKHWDDLTIVSDPFDLHAGPFERRHPIAGSFCMMTTDVRVAGRDDLVMRFLAPADADSAAAFLRLAALGTPSTRATRLPQ